MNRSVLEDTRELAYQIKSAINSLVQRESSFDRAFADIAHAIIRDKAPRLADYEVGFQVLDKSDDNTRATAVMGFKIGDQWVFVPFFFINGDVRGHDIMILRDGDMMLPLKDNWIDYLFKSTGSALGETVSKDYATKGPKPDIYTLMTPYPAGFKYASDQNPIDVFTKKAREGLKNRPTLLSFIEGRMAHIFAERLMKIARTLPEIAAFLEENYGISNITKMAWDAVEKLKKRPRIKERKVRVYTPADIDLPHHMKLAAYRDGFVVEDRRSPDEVAKLIDGMDRVTMGEMTFSNPDGVGLYDVLVLENGKLSIMPALICKSSPDNILDVEETPKFEFPPPRPCCGPRRDRTQLFVISTLRSTKQRAVGFYAEPHEVWTVQENMRVFGQDEPASVTQALEKITRPITDLTGEMLNRNRRANRGWVKLYLISPHLQFHRIELYAGNGDNDSVRVSSSDGATVIINGENKITILKSKSKRIFERIEPKNPNHITVYVPEGTRFVLEEDDYQPAGAGRNRTTLAPAKPSWTEHMFLKRGYYLKVRFDGLNYHINGEVTDRYGACKNLIYKHNLSEDDAREILKTASYNGRYDGFVVLPKKAIASLPSSQTDFFGHNAELPVSTREVVPELDAANSDLSGYNPLPETDKFTMPPKPPDPNSPDIQRMLEAARAGKRDVFDLSGISALASEVGLDNIIDDYGRKIFKAMDAAGRLLFLFYRFRPEFMERIGESDAPKFENLIREIFDKLGDLSLLLREKATSLPEGQRGVLDIHEFQEALP